MQLQLPQQGYYDLNNVFHAGPMPMMPQQSVMTPQQAQAQVAAHAASQQAGPGVLVRGQPRQQSSATNARTGDPSFEFDAQAQEFVRR